MSLPILQPTINTIQIRGDVRIAEGAIVADGVILNAPQNSTIIIHAGVCLGMGTIITAYPDSTIEIKQNTIVGAGCLIFGQCTIGTQVSLGACVTIYNTSIDNLAVIPSGIVKGDSSREYSENQISTPKQPESKPLVEDVWGEEVSAPVAPSKEAVLEQEEDLREQKVEPKSDAVVGQVYINRLLLTLFPEKNNPL
ncbi:MAG: carbon dioxide concentrating mechanism protein [Cyanobacterium sp. T60_A2020_053]|nr:carbon dioxide concentrating mechanism protein [Cyanobacterium sp. T60_A2020_053]